MTGEIGRWGQQNNFLLKIIWSALRLVLWNVDLKFEDGCSEQLTVFKLLKCKETKEGVVKEVAVLRCSFFNRIEYYLNTNSAIDICQQNLQNNMKNSCF